MTLVAIALFEFEFHLPLIPSIMQYADRHSPFLLMPMTGTWFPVTIIFANIPFAASPSVRTLVIPMKWRLSVSIEQLHFQTHGVSPRVCMSDAR